MLIESACRSHGEVCPDYLKMELLTGWISRADQGAPGVKDMLTLTPCDLFPLIRGRTLWLLGDSQTLVGFPPTPDLELSSLPLLMESIACNSFRSMQKYQINVSYSLMSECHRLWPPLLPHFHHLMLHFC